MRAAFMLFLMTLNGMGGTICASFFRETRFSTFQKAEKHKKQKFALAVPKLPPKGALHDIFEEVLSHHSFMRTMIDLSGDNL